ncbi:MAG: DUF1016 family protein [Chitinophagaceae bacterium]|nr:DUF1016 family protein [Chitinophagaceae bacterium]MCA6460344.1 DUF1016 family protein [Chitinophagaceae bacterium]MCA6465231.1 DUF1016 family protein [Chitinophagaceae bacterium]
MNKEYITFIKELKGSIVRSRYLAAKLANREQLLLYLKVGESLSEKVTAQKWGTGVLQKLAEDLQMELPGLKGFSYRNMQNMRQFYTAYRQTPIWQPLVAQFGTESIVQALPAQLKSNKETIGQPVVDQLQHNDNQSLRLFLGISFTHHLAILNGCSNMEERWFYISKACVEFWSYRTLEYHISSKLFYQEGVLPNNFGSALPRELGTNAMNVFRDNYLFDFIELDESDNERVFEGQLVSKIRDSIMALGKGFCFIGNQFRLEVGGQEFFVDLLFYNRVLRSLVAFELKTGKFKPEYAGQLNFYLNVLDDKVKMPEENPSIGIILCKEKNNTVVEYAFQNIARGMGAATFKTSQKVPDDMKGILPDAKELAKLL